MYRCFCNLMLKLALQLFFTYLFIDNFFLSFYLNKRNVKRNFVEAVFWLNLALVLCKFNLPCLTFLATLLPLSQLQNVCIRSFVFLSLCPSPWPISVFLFSLYRSICPSIYPFNNLSSSIFLLILFS
jgi:hypothetical protein